MWPTAPLGEITTKIGSGSTPRGGEEAYKASGVPLVRSMNVHDGEFITDGLAFLDEQQASGLKHVTLQAGDVLLNITGASVARVCRLPDHLSGARVNQHVSIIRPDAKRLNSEFLEHLLRAPEAKAKLLRVAGAGATREAITKSQIEEFAIPLPPLEEQRRIAAILDRADDLRRKRKRALELLDTLTQSIFLDMFGEDDGRWGAILLGNAIEEFRYGTSNKSGPTGFPVIRIPNVVGGRIDLSDLKLVPLDASEFERLKMRHGDLLLVRTNGNPDYVGRCAVFDKDIEGARGLDPSQLVYASYLIRARLPTKSLNPYFVQAFLSSRAGRKSMLERAKTSAGQFNINTESLSSISVPTPPRRLQDEFEGRRRLVRSSISIQSGAVRAVDAMFQSLQHRAFSGQL